VADGTIFVADSDYSSQVAGKTFSTGQWTAFDGTSWDITPFAHISLGIPAGSAIAFAGNTVLQWFLPCNGSPLSKANDAYLFSAIRTRHKTRPETAAKFSIPDYNSEHRFLHIYLSAGPNTAPELSDLIRHLSRIWQRSINPSTLFSGVFAKTTCNNSDVHARGNGYDSCNDEKFKASRYNGT
jgi:hypothetical protein